MANQRFGWTCKGCTLVNESTRERCCVCLGCRPVAGDGRENKIRSRAITIKSNLGETETVVVSQKHLVLDVVGVCPLRLTAHVETYNLFADRIWLRAGRRVDSIAADTWNLVSYARGTDTLWLSDFHHGFSYQYLCDRPPQQDVLGLECHRPLQLTGGRQVRSVSWNSQRYQDTNRTISVARVHAQAFCVRDLFGRRVATSGPSHENVLDRGYSDIAYRHCLIFRVPLSEGRHWVTLNADMSDPNDHHETRHVWQQEKWSRVVRPALLGLRFLGELVDLCQGYDSWVGFEDEPALETMTTDRGDKLLGCIVQEIDFV